MIPTNSDLHSRTVYAVDIGSTRPRRGGGVGFAWARLRDDGGIAAADSIVELVNRVTEDLRLGHSVALGFDVTEHPNAARKEHFKCGHVVAA